MAGWKKVLLIGVATAVSVGVLLTVVGVGALLWANSVAEELGEPAPVPTAVTIAVAREAAAPAAQGSTSKATPRVEIELQDGRFEIRSGPAGTEIQVDGEYAENYYELIEEQTPADASGGWPHDDDPAASHQQRAGQDDGGVSRERRPVPPAEQADRSDPRRAPDRAQVGCEPGGVSDRPGGLTLTDLDADLSMGDHRLGFGEPLAEELQQLRVSGDMGNIDLAQLGNARARELRVSSRMGNFTVDLGGEWPTDDVSELEVTHSMGDLRLRIPNSVRVSPDSRSSARMAESSRIDRREETADPAAPVLRLDLSTTMGGTRIIRYDADVPEELAAHAPSPPAEPTR